MDGWFSGCNCSTQTLQTLKVPAAFVVRNVRTDLTLSGARRMHVQHRCSMFPARTGSVLTGAVAYLKCHQTLKVHLEKDLAPPFAFCKQFDPFCYPLA